MGKGKAVNTLQQVNTYESRVNNKTLKKPDRRSLHPKDLNITINHNTLFLSANKFFLNHNNNAKTDHEGSERARGWIYNQHYRGNIH